MPGHGVVTLGKGFHLFNRPAASLRGMEDTGWLPKADRESTARELERQENPAAFARALAGIFGRDGGAVLAGIFKESAPLVNVVANMDKGRDDAGKMILESARDKNFMEAHKAMLLRRGVDFKDMEREVDEALADFSASLLGGGESGLANAAHEATLLRALGLMGRNGLDMKEAVAQAASEVVLERYSFMRSGKGSVARVPSEFDGQAVSLGAERILKELKGGDVSLETPSGMPKAKAEELILQTIRRDGRWVTNEDESGLYLFLGGRLVLDSKGRPFMRKWEELTAKGIEWELTLSEADQDM